MPPLSIVPPTSMTAPASLYANPVLRMGPPRRLLVVDDLPDVLDLLRGMARRIPGTRVQVVTALSGQRAMDLLRRERFDVVLSDQRMGPVDGLSVLAAARRVDPECRRILMTGYHDVPVPLDHVNEAAVDAYLAKPFRAQETIHLLEAFLLEHPLSIASGRARARFIEQQAREQGLPVCVASGGHASVFGAGRPLR